MWPGSTVRWCPSAKRIILLARLVRPAVYAVSRQPDRVDVEHRQRSDAAGDEDTGSTEVMRDDGRGGEHGEGLQHAANCQYENH